MASPDTVMITCAGCGGPIEVEVALGELRMDEDGNAVAPVIGNYDHLCPVTGNHEVGTVRA